MKGIVWLASYPKSGNTWFRSFLVNLLRNPVTPVSINDLFAGPMASARTPFDDALGYDSSELTFDEVDRLRPEVYRHQAATARETLYCKIHDAYTFLPDGRPIVPPDATKCTLYFVRNPLDVCVSFAHHGGHEDFDRIIRQMRNPGYMFCNPINSESNQLRQKILTWSQHAVSWVEAPDMRVHLVRYEDMKRQTEDTFLAAVRFAGLPDDLARVRKAIAFSRFEELRAQEKKAGFGEKMTKAKAFFRKGEIGSWREALTPEQVQRIIADHGAAMRRFGYLDDNDAPVY